MQDRFKFKAINIETKEVIYVDNLYFFEEEGIEYVDDNGIGRGHTGSYYILQCTGLKDKNGKLIYEGDILKDDSDILASVVWEDEEAKFIIEEKNRYVIDCSSDVCNEIEIIGNIYENPELLESEK